MTDDIDEDGPRAGETLSAAWMQPQIEQQDPLEVAMQDAEDDVEGVNQEAGNVVGHVEEAMCWR